MIHSIIGYFAVHFLDQSIHCFVEKMTEKSEISLLCPTAQVEVLKFHPKKYSVSYLNNEMHKILTLGLLESSNVIFTL